MPYAFAAKAPNAGRDWAWQWVFPAARLATVDAEAGKLGRFPVHPTTVQRQLTRAARRAGIPKRVHPHVLRHSFATHFLDDGEDIRKLQALLGHEDIRMTMIYAHLIEGAAASSPSPLDRLSFDDWEE